MKYYFSIDSTWYSPLLEEQGCGSCDLLQCRTDTHTSDHLYRTDPGVSHVSDIYSPPDYSQDPSVCVSLDLSLSNEAAGEFHSKSSDTPDMTSGLSAFFPHRCHTKLD